MSPLLLQLPRSLCGRTSEHSEPRDLTRPAQCVLARGGLRPQCPRLQKLYLSHNRIASVDALYGFNSLTVLCLYHNSLIDLSEVLSVLRTLPKVRSGRVLRRSLRAGLTAVMSCVTAT